MLIAGENDIKQGKITDVYFMRTIEVLKGHVKLYVSGGVGESQMADLNPFVDGYGVGTSISNARVLDFAMDIVEIEGRPLAKRGKMSGAKRVLRCADCHRDRIVPLGHPTENRCECGGSLEDVLLPWYDKDGFLFGGESLQSIRRYVLEQLPHFGFEQ